MHRSENKTPAPDIMDMTQSRKNSKQNSCRNLHRPLRNEYMMATGVTP